MPGLGAQVAARVDPGGRDRLGIEKSGAQRGGQQLAHRHDAGAQTVRQIAGLGERVGHPFQVGDEAFENGGGLDAEALREFTMAVLDVRQHRRVGAAERGRQQRLETIGDPGHRGVNHHGPQARAMLCQARSRWCRRQYSADPSLAMILKHDALTLVPPNLRTRTQALDAHRARLLIVFEDIAQLFFQLPLGEHILDPAPRRLAALTGGRRFGPTLSAFYQRIEVMRFFGFAKKLIVDIEMFVFAFAHFSRKALEINRIDMPDAGSCALYPILSGIQLAQRESAPFHLPHSGRLINISRSLF